jgi:CubicO group peptidase (beta-lactamase class C family)
MKLLKIIIIAAAASLLLYQNTYSQDSTVVNPGPQIQKILDEHKVPGAAMALVSKDSLIWMGTLGRADIKNNIPVTENTLFGIGSISKTFLSMAAMVAQEKGFLDIHDPIKQAIPSLPISNEWSSTDPVRLVHLLEHTSGFDEAHFNLFAQADSATPFNEVMNLSREALVSRWRPGRYYVYNNLGAIVAAHVIEKSVDGPFEKFVRQNILLPLKMNRAAYHPTETLEPYLSKGYGRTENTVEPYPSLAQWPAGGLVTSIRGMSNFVSMFLNNGKFNGRQILTSSSIKKMETPETSIRARKGIRYGYGKGLRAQLEKGYLFYGHDGSYGGFLSEFGYSRELDVGYVILINNRDGNKAISAIRKELLKDFIPEKEPDSLPVSEKNIGQLHSLLGCYQPITSSMEITHFAMRLIDMQCVIEEDGQLYQKSIIGDRQPLIKVRDTLFRRSGEPIATSVFVNTQAGRWQWLDETAYQQIPSWWTYVQFYTAAACLFIMLLAFVTLLFWIPIRLIKKKKHHLLLQLLPFLAICSLIGMIISVTIGYDPFELYSWGAILFYLFGWLFLLFSVTGLVQIIRRMYRKIEINAWIKYHALLASLSCCIVAGYLLYWGVIGLRLWNY